MKSSRNAAQETQALIEFRGLKKSFGAKDVLCDLSFEVMPRDSLAIVGESGSGKSTVLNLIAGLIAPKEKEMIGYGAELGGGHHYDYADRTIQMVFQDPYASLDPRQRAWRIATSSLRLGLKARREQATELFAKVALDERLLDAFPHSLSGGQRQRLAVARALAPQPKLLLLDEPLSALDVSVQAQVIALLQQIRAESQMTFIYVTHDLATVPYLCNKVLVLQGGRISEMGTCEAVIDSPQSPYTRALIAAARKG